MLFSTLVVETGLYTVVGRTQAEGLKYINTSGNTRFSRKLGDYVYIPKDEWDVSKKYLNLFCSQLQIWHPLCLQLDYPRMKEN